MEIGDYSNTPLVESPAQSWWERLTIADGLFVLVVILGSVLRFVDLGRIPLSAAEAELALAVWRFWQPGNAEIALSSPAYFTLTSLLTQIFGFSDGVMRLVPALFGLAVVCLPWLLRRQLGDAGALVVCGFLAISPLNVILSRTVGGEAIALFAVFLLAVAVMRYADTPALSGGKVAAPHWLYLAAAAMALGFTSAPLFYSGLVTLVIVWVVIRLLKLSLFPEREPLDRRTWRNTLLVGGGVFVAFSSKLLWVTAGFGGSAQILGTWVAQIGGDDSGRILADPFLALARYEPALVILGVVAVLWALWRASVSGLALVYWLLAALILMLFQPGIMSNAALVTLPGYLLVGLLAGLILSERPMTGLTWIVAGGVFLFCMLMLVNLGRFVRVVIFDPNEIQYLAMMIIGLALLAVLLYLVLTLDVTAVTQGLLLGLIAFLVIITWGTGWWLGHLAANDPRERWVQSATDSDIRLLVTTLQSLSSQLSGSDTDLDVASSVDTTVLRWYLRSFRNARIGQTLPAGGADVLITSAQAEPALANNYSGADFGLSLYKNPPEQQVINVRTFTDTLRWWFFHDSPAQPANERVIVWVKAQE
ncbi:MAG: glycosyltransferase family 39 protein [Anaerolineae bacterium]|nr:glycosyltransferase family 39 protein [Anaerolineae bacterium]